MVLIVVKSHDNKNGVLVSFTLFFYVLEWGLYISIGSGNKRKMYIILEASTGTLQASNFTFTATSQTSRTNSSASGGVVPEITTL